MKILAIGYFIMAAVSLFFEAQSIINGTQPVRNLLVPIMWAGFGVWQWTWAVKRARRIYLDDSVRRQEEVRGLVEKYRPLAATVPAPEFCELVLADGTPRLYTAVLLRDLYGLNLMECKSLLGTALQNESKSDGN